MSIARIRKALAAAAAGFVAGAGAYLSSAGHLDLKTITEAVGAGVTAAILAGVATYVAPANAAAATKP
jgi:hypothetical protein